MRKNLQQARQNFHLTQAEVAQKLNIRVTSYQNIEYGARQGSIDVWDALEDLFGIPQRKLRENFRAATPTEKEPGGNRAKSSTPKG